MFEEESPKHVKDMKHHVVISEDIIEEPGFKSTEGAEEVTRRVDEREGKSSESGEDQVKEHYEKTRITKPIALDDLFKRRSLKPGDRESEVRRVLLYGNPGSGKTCITKVVAHKWALGEMAQEFETVYVVPVRVLNGTDHKGRQWTSLEAVISQICYSERDNEFDCKDLIAQIQDELDCPSTLLMLDGLDEANDHSKEIISKIWGCTCKILLLSRPYNLRNIEMRADIQVECLGFDDQQLQDYIKSKLSEDEAPRLIRSLKNTTAMWEMAHIPVTAHILCSLSKEHGTAIEEEKKRASMFQIYNDMTNYVWKRFEKKPAARNVQKAELFKDLEKIAFESLRKGRILIHERFVMQHATSKNAARTFKESGLLLLVLEGKEYQFLHLTCQEYFAGRYIARMLKQKESDEKTRVLDFIRGGKYDEKHKLTLTFAMHAFADGRSKQALVELLWIIDEEPVEVLGIQHLFLRMRVLEVILEKTDENDMEDVLNDEHAVKLVESARQLLERTVDDILIREIVVKEFQQLPSVLEGFPLVLDDTIDEVKKLLAHSQELTRMETTKIAEVLKLARHSSKHSKEIGQFLSQKAKAPDSWCDKRECTRRLCFIAHQMPRQVGDHLSTLAKGCDNKDWHVRRVAIEAIGRVVAVAPTHAGKYLSTLARGCSDGHWRVRQAATEAISRVVVAAPQNASKHLSTLTMRCADVSKYVRRAAMEAIGRVDATALQNADELLSTLARGSVDASKDVRRAAMNAIGRVVVAVPQHFGEHLSTLAKGYCDEDWSVRQAAMEAIGRVAAAAPQYAGEHLSTMAKRCDDEDKDMRRAALEAIGHVVLAAPQNAGKHLPRLTTVCADGHWRVRQAALETVGRVSFAASQYGGEHLLTLAKCCVDEDWHVRQAAMEAIGRVVATEPQHGGKHLLALTKGCADEDEDVRRAAMEAIGRVVATAPQHGNIDLSALTRGCVDEHWRVRQAAMEAIGNVSVVAPQHAVENLSTLARGCTDVSKDVRRAAMVSISRVVVAVPQHAGEHLSTLTRGYCDKDWRVRQAAMEAIGDVSVAAPQHAVENLLTLARGCDDEHWRVRQAAMETIGRVVVAVPQHAGENLSTLAKVRDDEHWRVRQAAMEAIGDVGVAAPQHAGEHLSTLARGCADVNEDVRNAARKALESVKLREAISSAISFPSTNKGGFLFFFMQNAFTLDPLTKFKTVPFVLHTTFSQEIGKWKKEAINLFIGYLRQEFDTEFPRLLKNSGSSEQVRKSTRFFFRHRVSNESTHASTRRL